MMDHLDPILNAAKLRLDDDLNAALSVELQSSVAWSFTIGWNGRQLVLEKDSKIIATYRTLWLNEHLYFEDGTPQQVAKLIVGLGAIAS